jgi:hypothetical protein
MMGEFTDLHTRLSVMMAARLVPERLSMSPGVWRDMCGGFIGSLAGAPKDGPEGKSVFGLPVELHDDATAVLIGYAASPTRATH